MALDPVPQLDEIDALLDDLSSSPTLDVYEALLPYDGDMVAAAAAHRALAGGGGGGGSLTTPDASGDTDSITIKTGDSSAGDSGDITIDTGAGDDSDGDVLIQGAVAISKQGVVFTEGLEGHYEDTPAFVVSDAGFGAHVQVIGLLIVDRAADLDAYPDTGANYILIAKDPATGHAWGVTPAGYEYFDNPTGIGAPDDADLNAHQRRQWYDPTTGAPAFRFKQKDAAGTVTAGKSAAMSSDGTAFLGVDKPSVGTADAASILAALVTLGLVTDDT